ncbi:MAG: hypothetical protein KDB96_19545, partial [Flavobacteriales bacterium]|nr:hypothetical protein [Flavobacteriales bacterium]
WNNNNYLAYLVTCSGVEGPVTTSIGYTPAPDATGSTVSAIGCMKLSRQGTHMASVWTDPVVSTPQVFQSLMIVVLLDFNAMTGTFSNLRSDAVGPGTDILKGYGVEWSPSGRFLYVNDNGLVGGMASSSVYQYDVQDPDPMSTRTLVGGGSPAHGSMQLAPNGTIYIARLNGAQYLAGITDPDVAGSGCGYVNAAVTLGGVPST